MVVHHLNCGTLRPLGGGMPWGLPRRLVCHCLLIETQSNGLVLVDTGLGEADLENPQQRLGHFTWIARPTLNSNEPAIRQIKALGYSPNDVRHILLTHLDLDHTGGLSDFPQAKVHVFAAEFVAAMAPATVKERLRYRCIHWEHGPDWVVHKVSGERFFGFECVREIEGLGSQFMIIPLTGHTWGHSGVAIDTSQGWLLHAGDAYYHHSQIESKKVRIPRTISFLEQIMQMDSYTRMHNLYLLRKVAQDRSVPVKIFSSHDSVEFARFSVS